MIKLEFIEYLLESLGEPAIILDNDLKLISCNQSFISTFCGKEKIQKKNIFDINDKQWDFSEFRKLLTKIIPKKKSIKHYKIIHEFEQLGIKSLILSIEQFKLKESKPYYMIKIVDVAYKKLTGNMLEIIEEKLDILNDISNIFTNYSFKEIFLELTKVLRTVFECNIVIIGYTDDKGDILIPIGNSADNTKRKKALFKINNVFWNITFGSEPLKQMHYSPLKVINFPEGSIPIYNSIFSLITYNKDEIGRILLANKSDEFKNFDKYFLETISTYISPMLSNIIKDTKVEKKGDIIYEDKIVDIDKVDTQILCELYKDGSQTLKDLSEKILKPDGDTMSSMGIMKRIRKLKKDQLMHIQANINLKRFNFRIAFYLINLKHYSDLNKFINMKSQCPRICLLAPLMGRYHMILGLLGSNLEEINYCINHCEIIDKNKIDFDNSNLLFGLNLEIPKFFPSLIFCKDMHYKECQSFKNFFNG